MTPTNPITQSRNPMTTSKKSGKQDTVANIQQWHMPECTLVTTELKSGTPMSHGNILNCSVTAAISGFMPHPNPLNPLWYV